MSILDPGQKDKRGVRIGNPLRDPVSRSRIRAGGDRDCEIQAIRHLPR